MHRGLAQAEAFEFGAQRLRIAATGRIDQHERRATGRKPAKACGRAERLQLGEHAIRLQRRCVARKIGQDRIVTGVARGTVAAKGAQRRAARAHERLQVNEHGQRGGECAAGAEDGQQLHDDPTQAHEIPSCRDDRGI